jgi:predicted ATPase
LYVKVPAPGMEPGLERMLDGIRAEGALSYKNFTDAAELRDLVAGDLAALLAEGFGARDGGVRLPAVPLPVTTLVGRDGDVEQVAGMLAAAGRRLVVLTGPGGAGKTRLALAVAERTRRQWPDGAAFVDLSAVSDPALVPDAIASALALVGQGRERPLDTLKRGLAGRGMLIVLDNFEQVLDAAPVVADLLQSAPGLRVLATSRAVLRVRGEQEWRVDPLGVPPPGIALEALAESPAVRLFVDRVRDVQPGFTLSSQNAETVAELCRRLDGLPLALELAAASMRLLTPGQVLARLSQQLERPGALADLPGRQQTLTATIQWSYDLLPAPAQRMLARLSVFAAPFTAAAAEAVGSQDDRDAVQDLSTLLDHSMLSPAERPDGQRAFRLLDPIRRFAAAQLTDASPALSRLQRYLLDVVEAAGPQHGSRDSDMRRLDSEQPNVRAVLSWITRDQQPPDPLLRALGGVWVWMLVRGHLRQSSTLWQQIAPLLARQPRAGGDRMARAWLLAYARMNQGEYAKAIALVDEILPDARRTENPSRTALLLMVRGLARLRTDRGPARGDFAEALAVARTAGDRLVLGVALEHYGVLRCLDGDPDQATALHQEMLQIARSLDDENLRAEARYVLAVDALADRDAGSAAPHLAAAIRHYQNLGHLEGLTRCLAALSALALQHGDPHLAARLIGTAAEVRDRFGGSGLRPWPWAAQAEQPTIEQAKALMPAGEYTAQLAAGRGQTIDEALASATPIPQDRQSPADLPVHQPDKKELVSGTAPDERRAWSAASRPLS